MLRLINLMQKTFIFWQRLELIYLTGLLHLHRYRWIDTDFIHRCEDCQVSVWDWQGIFGEPTQMRQPTICGNVFIYLFQPSLANRVEGR